MITLFAAGLAGVWGWLWLPERSAPAWEYLWMLAQMAAVFGYTYYTFSQPY